MKAMHWYILLPIVPEYMIEHGWTRCFSRINDVGWAAYAFYSVVYLVIVEFGIYWMHKELHDIKPLYKYLHATHHIYNKQNTLSPFAGRGQPLIIFVLKASQLHVPPLCSTDSVLLTEPCKQCRHCSLSLLLGVLGLLLFSI